VGHQVRGLRAGPVFPRWMMVPFDETRVGRRRRRLVEPSPAAVLLWPFFGWGVRSRWPGCHDACDLHGRSAHPLL